MIPNRERSSVAELGPRHCPAAIAHAKLGTPREASPEMIIGKCAHAVAEAVAMDRESLAIAVADAATVAIIRDGIRFEGGEPEFPSAEQALEGRALALRMLDRYPLPAADFMQAEAEVNLSPLGWGSVESSECQACAGTGVKPGPEVQHKVVDCPACSSGETWPAHWHQLLDLIWQGQEEDAYGQPILVAGGRDLKGWNASQEWFSSLQGKGYAVALASLFPDAQMIRLECVSYQMAGAYFDEIDLRTDEGRDRLDDCRRGLELATEALAGQVLDVEALAMPGAGCAAGYGGCPYFLRCEPALRRCDELFRSRRSDELWELVERMLDHSGESHDSTLLRLAERLGGIVPRSSNFSDISETADAYALGHALYQEGARQLKGYGGGPIETASGHLVGWKDTTTPTGTVDANAPLWIAREYAAFVLHRPDEYERVEGLIRAAGVGFRGQGVPVVRKLVAKCEAAGMLPEDAVGLLDRCLGPKPGRKLAIWRGKPPGPPEDDLEQLRESLANEGGKRDA